MTKSATVRARMRPDLKKRAEMLLQELGLSTTQAITLFYRQLVLRKGLPFSVAIPNKRTRRTFEDTDAGRNLIVCKNAGEMLKKLGI